MQKSAVRRATGGQCRYTFPVTVLALDYGTRRVGVAVSGPGGRTALPVTTLPAEPRTKLLAAIERLVMEYAVTQVLVGSPRRVDGGPGTLAAAVDSFCADLRGLGLSVVVRDEAHTSEAAAANVRGRGGKTGSRAGARTREKRAAVVDREAAAVLLRGYLDERSRS
jgi:putative Holliday junction resolvase